MKKLIRRIIFSLVGLFAVIGVATSVFLASPGGRKIGIRVLMENKIEDVFYCTYDVDRVEIFKVKDTGAKDIDDGFPVIPYGSSAAILGQKSLLGDQARSFLSDWAQMGPDYKMQALCHDPVYAVEFYTKSKRVFRTTICWHCSNFYLEILPGAATWYGFDSNSPGAQKVLAYLEAEFKN